MHEDKPYWVALNHVPGIGPTSFTKLLKTFGTAQRAWEAKEQTLATCLPKKVVGVLVAYRLNTTPTNLYSLITHSGMSVITKVEPEYPALLAEIYDPPPVLYVRGALDPVDAKAIAIVGTRRNTSYGKVVTEQLAQGLASQGFTIVSGLARGIDAIAHKAALEAGGRTIAVLGCGLNHVYPPEHYDLARRIVESGGAVISEFPPDLPPVPGNFPARNRIISGLSLGIIVTEAAEKSGTMLTVDSALEQGRDVFAVPGPITSILSVGTMNLIKQGAILVTGVSDVLSSYTMPSLNLEHDNQIPDTVLENTREGNVLKLLENEPLFFDLIVNELQLPANEVSSMLTFLEIDGRVKQVENNQWMRI